MLYFCAALLALAVSVQGHARFVCPMPRNGNSGNKVGPCGAGDSGHFTTISPGPMTVRFEETVYHLGAPTSFRLFRGSDMRTSCLLLDHMPHSESWKMYPYCNIDNYPVGKCNLTTGYVTINIPDIECNDCVLQLISAMTDKYADNSTCVEKDLSVNCSTYYSCANLRIIPTEKGKGKGLESCQRYEDNVNGDWPYINLTTGVYRKEPSFNFSKNGWLTGDDYVGGSARYPSAVKPVGPCALSSSRYGVIFNEALLVGAVSLVRNDVHLFVSGMLSEQLAEAWLHGAAGRLNLSTASIKDTYLDGTESIASFGEGFFSTLHLRLKNGAEHMGDIQEAIVTVSLRDGLKYHGEVVYTANGTRAFAIGNFGEAKVTNVTLNGPSRNTATPLERIDTLLQQRNGITWALTEWNDWTGSRILPSGSRKYLTLMYYWIEYAYVEVQTDRSTQPTTVTGRIPKPAECIVSDSRCLGNKVFRLSPSDTAAGEYPGGPAISVYGFGSVSISNNEYLVTIAMVNIADTERIVSVSVAGTKLDKEVILHESNDSLEIVAGYVPRSTKLKSLEIVVSTQLASYTGYAGEDGSPDAANSARLYFPLFCLTVLVIMLNYERKS